MTVLLLPPPRCVFHPSYAANSPERRCGHHTTMPSGECTPPARNFECESPATGRRLRFDRAVPDWRRAVHLHIETDDSVRPRLLNRSLRSLVAVNGLDRIDTSAPHFQDLLPSLVPLTGDDVPLRSGPAARMLVRPRDPPHRGSSFPFRPR